MDKLTLRTTIADIADTLTSEQFTEPQLAARLAAWQAQAPDATPAELTIYALNEARTYSEELLTRVLTAVLAD